MIVGAGSSGNGRHDVNMSNRGIVNRARGYLARPFNHHRHTQSPFKHSNFPSSEGVIYLRDANISSPSVITCKDYKSVIREALLVKSIKNSPDTPINRANHSCINPLSMWLYITHCLKILSLCLKWSMRSPMS